MPNLSPGALFGQRRYLVKARLDQGLYYHHQGEVLFDHLPAKATDDRMVVVFRTINYDTFAPEFQQTFPAFVGRRRTELKREAELLASYHELTAHVPQIIDILEGTNSWDASLVPHNLVKGEPCLVLEYLPARSLSEIGHDVAPEEALTIVEKLLSVLRVFHIGDKKNLPKRYFGTLTPADVLIDRTTSDCWFHNLWKLYSTTDLSTRRLLCEREAHAFVSPALAGYLLPVVKPPANAPKPNPDRADLYSVGAILYWLLAGLPDLSSQPLGWFTAAEVAELKEARGLPDAIADFLTGLAEHRFPFAEEALEALCKARGIAIPARYTPPKPPSAKAFSEPVFTPGTIVAQRYTVTAVLTAGAMGSVFLGRDERTRALVAMKIVLYRDDNLASLRTEHQKLVETVRNRREELLDEARLILRAHHRTPSVPQLLDVVLARSPDPILAGHHDPELSGEHEPVLVQEFIPGNSLLNILEERTFGDEDELLRLGRGLCSILSTLHEERGNVFHLYMDWKPDNIMYHPESGNVTVIDMGGVATVVGGVRKNKGVFFTPLFAGPEETTRAQGNPNMHPSPTFDLHGLAAVLWRLAVPPVSVDAKALNDAATNASTVPVAYPLLQVALLPPNWNRLRPILQKGLQPDPALRYQSADEMRTAIVRALGLTSAAPPAGVSSITSSPQPGCKVEVRCTLPVDPYAAELVLCRDRLPPANAASATPWQQQAIADADRGKGLAWLDDSIRPDWIEVHYTAWTVGLNKKTSAVTAHKAMLLVDPEQIVLLRHERSLELRWKTPAVVSVTAGEVIVERLDLGGRRVYSGRGEKLVEDNLDPAHEVRYRLFSKLPHGESSGTEIAAKPLPTLAKILDVQVQPEDRCTRLSWRMTGDAADEIVLLRAERPMTLDDIKKPDPFRQADPIRLTLNASFRLTGTAPGQPVGMQAQADGSFLCEWIDMAARPGTLYYYAPLLVYRDDARRWVGPQGVGMAFAEATLRAEPMPHGVRLSWTLPEPDRTESVLLERLDGSMPAQRLHPTRTSYLDRNLSPDRAYTYRLRVKYAAAESAGVAVVARPLDESIVLPRLIPRPAAPVLERAGREIRWQPEGGGVMLLSLPAQGMLICQPANAGAYKVEGSTRGEYEAIVRRVAANGQVSTPATIRVGEV